MMFGKASPKVMMQTASFKTNTSFRPGFISRYGVPLDFSAAMEPPVGGRLYAAEADDSLSLAGAAVTPAG